MANHSSSPNKRFSKRASRIAVGGILMGFFLMIAIESVSGVFLENRVVNLFKSEIETLTIQHITHQITTTQKLLNQQLRNCLHEQAALAAVLQKAQDNETDFAPVLRAMERSPYFADTLDFYGQWYQNQPNEPGAVLIPKYLLDENHQISKPVSSHLKDSLILDWLGMPFYDYGTPKLWMYYTGGVGSSYMRIYPWSNLGESLQSIYPEFNSHENWETFNPGLIQSWKSEFAKNPELRNQLSQLAVVKPPTQDGGTGRMIITINHPIWDKNRSNIVGSLNYDVELSQFSNQIKEIQVCSKGFAYLANKSGTLLAVSGDGLRQMGLPDGEKHPTTRKGTGYNWLDLNFSKSQYPEIRNIHSPKGNETTHTELLINGEKYLHFQINLSAFNGWTPSQGIYPEVWTIGYLIPYDELMQPFNDSIKLYRVGAHQTILVQGFVVILLMLLLTGLMHWLNQKNLKNLSELTAAAHRISEGNLDSPIDIHSSDEIGQLADSLRVMQGEIKRRMFELNEGSDRLRHEMATRELREQQLAYLSQYDPITDLPNQNVLLSRLEDWLSSSDFTSSQGALILLGLDDFRKMNETFSRRGGDHLLNQVAQRLMNLRNQYSLICRLGGDEFALIYHLGSRLDDIRIKAEEILEVFEKPFDEGDVEVFLSASMGVCFFPLDGIDPDELMKNAATALNTAKATGKGSYSFYDASMDENARKKRKLATALRKAMDQQELSLVYQPIVQLSDNRLLGFEALIRWHHPEMGLITPSTFIPLAEETGLIVPIGNWVLYEACRQLKEWVTRWEYHLTVSVNISSLQFRLPDFVDTVKEMILITGLPPHLLNIELTEGLLIEDVPRVRDMLTQLRTYGVEISIDDFGTGYSSLNYIRDFPVNKLKIDRSFIRDFPARDTGTIARTIIQLAENLNMKTVAEGIETPEQLAFLMKNGCIEGQGYYFDTPLTPVDVETLMDNHKYLLAPASPN